MILYLDNLRGFKNAFVELSDITFLVGENSTGKSTVLKIMSLLSDQSFNYSGEFRNKYVDLGPFKEIINTDGRKKGQFRIGLKKNNPTSFNLDYDEVLLTFIELDGFPVVRDVFIRNRTKVMLLKLSDNGIFFRKKNSSYDGDNWVHELSKLSEFSEEVELGDLKVPDQILKLFRRNPFFYLFLLNSYEQTKDFFTETSFASGSLLEEMIWVDPIRSKPQRTYEPKNIDYSPEGEHIPTILRDILIKKGTTQSLTMIEELENFGKFSGLFDKIFVDRYRRSIDSPFALLLKMKNKRIKISNVGYGVSQILPILVEVIRQRKQSAFLIQQPEVHLHPKSQAFCGDFFYEQYLKHKKKFIIETHSDFIIDRFRINMKKNENNESNRNVSILFFYTSSKGNNIQKIEINVDGTYGQKQPKRFREFFLKEGINLLGL